jgi:hypothetical protein
MFSVSCLSITGEDLSIRRSSSIENLGLKNTSYDPGNEDLIEDFSDLIENIHSLKHLDIFGWNVENKGARKLASAIENSTHLETIMLLSSSALDSIAINLLRQACIQTVSENVKRMCMVSGIDKDWQDRDSS